MTSHIGRWGVLFEIFIHLIGHIGRVKVNTFVYMQKKNNQAQRQGIYPKSVNDPPYEIVSLFYWYKMLLVYIVTKLVTLSMSVRGGPLQRGLIKNILMGYFTFDFISSINFIFIIKSSQSVRTQAGRQSHYFALLYSIKYKCESKKIIPLFVIKNSITPSHLKSIL